VRSGTVKSSIGLDMLLWSGIGDTPNCYLPEPLFSAPLQITECRRTRWHQASEIASRSLSPGGAKRRPGGSQ
jgi:hypothetical protein